MTKAGPTTPEGADPRTESATRLVAERSLPTAMLAALGIVYGDLGTSPLYTFQTILGGERHPTPAFALGVLSLIFWALIVTISIKYCGFVMRADNHGEGGILALMSLVGRNSAERGVILVAFGLFGAALIYGDGVITPAISVLSALEGVNVATSGLKPYVMPAAVVILICLFAFQAAGSARIGKVFGPIMSLWFVAIGVIGAVGVMRHPGVIAAVDPLYAARFLIQHGWRSLFVLGGVFLAITGGEALYADMGHIGRGPIRLSWFCLVLPTLLLSYAGQTGLLLDKGSPIADPFFALVPHAALYPMVALATAATIIASQAIITGAFSLTRQAIQLGWFPGLNIRQTSDVEYGQIYVPAVNWAMMAVTVALTIGFRSSDRLAGAYGTAVSTTMLLTTTLLYAAMRERWKWPTPIAICVAGLFLIVDFAFFAANLLKIEDGGWIPLALGAAIFTVMTTWRKGRDAIHKRLLALEEAPERFLARLDSGAIPRVPGLAVFLSGSTSPAPPLMRLQAAQFGALQESLVTLTVHFEERPWVPLSERVDVAQIGPGFWHVTARFGFVEIPNLRAALACARDRGCLIDLDQAIYFGARDEVVRSKTNASLSGWRRMLFSFLYRNAVRTEDRFDLPPGQFVEIGRQQEL